MPIPNMYPFLNSDHTKNTAVTPTTTSTTQTITDKPVNTVEMSSPHLGRDSITYDSEYIYMADIRMNQIGSTSMDIPCHIHVGSLASFRNKSAKGDSSFEDFDDFEISLPFRLPMVIYRNLDLSSLNSFMSSTNSDLGTSIAAADTPDLGELSELTVNTQSLHNSLIQKSTEVYAVKPNGILTSLFSKVVDSGTTDVATYISNIKHLISYPTAVQIYAREQGASNYLYVVYNYKVTYRAAGWAVRWLGGINRPDYLKEPNRTLPDAYNGTVDFTWEVPAVAKYEYTQNKLTFEEVSYPTAKYSRKVDAGHAGNYSWNTKLIPNKSILAGGDFFFYYSLPSNNRCFIASYHDIDYDRLVVVTIYEKTTATPDGYTAWPFNDAMYVSYMDMSSSLTFTPASGPTDINIRSILSDNMYSSRMDNVHKVSMTKVRDNYIVSISYDNIDNKRVSMYTLLLKIDATATLTSSAVTLLNRLSNAGYADVLGIQGGD